MKPANLLYVCLLLPLYVFFLHAPAETNCAATELLAAEKQWSDAELNHDPVSLGKLMAEDFIFTEPDGSVMHKTEEVAFTADPDAHFDILESRDLKVQVHGDAAVVTGAVHEKGTYHGKTFEHRGRITDTWIRENGSWLCIAAHFSIPVQE
jgi:ketosteroid isomerase-like protein